MIYTSKFGPKLKLYNHEENRGIVSGRMTAFNVSSPNAEVAVVLDCHSKKINIVIKFVVIFKSKSELAG